MPTQIWNIFFDFHGVLADVTMVIRSYQYYLQRILRSIDIPKGKAIQIHDVAYRKWLNGINRISKEYDEGLLNSETFMQKYNQIDKDWELVILSYVPLERQKEVTPFLKTSILEYEALSNGKYPILYPEVVSVLSKLFLLKNLHMHIASSASSHHVKGALHYHNIDRFFKTIIGYDIVKAPKKARKGDYFRNMLKITRADPRKSIFIGDSLDEASIAKKCNMIFIMVDREEKNPTSITVDNSKFIVRDLTEIIEFIKKLIA
ncbi:MAG: HAD family hydrolase [Candidatus Hodarchaeota archaeon]